VKNGVREKKYRLFLERGVPFSGCNEGENFNLVLGEREIVLRRLPKNK